MTWEIWQIFNRALESLKIGTQKSKKFAIELAPLTKVYYVLWAKKSTAELCLVALKILKENWLVLSEMTWGI